MSNIIECTHRNVNCWFQSSYTFDTKEQFLFVNTIKVDYEFNKIQYILYVLLGMCNFSWENYSIFAILGWLKHGKEAMEWNSIHK